MAQVRKMYYTAASIRKEAGERQQSFFFIFKKRFETVYDALGGKKTPR